MSRDNARTAIYAMRAAIADGDIQLAAHHGIIYLVEQEAAEHHKEHRSVRYGGVEVSEDVS